MNADVPWASARVAVVTQVGAWYNVCSVTKEDYCPRKELLAMERDPAIQVFKAGKFGKMLGKMSGDLF